MFVTILLLQSGALTAAAVAPAAAPKPDLAIHARVTAKRLRVQREARASVTVYASPELQHTQRIVPSKPVPNGVEVSDVTIAIDATATLADPPTAPLTPEDSTGGTKP